MLDVDPLEIADKDFYFGNGCPECSKTGYRGRVGLFEMVVITDALRELINQKAPTLAIRQKALEQGMRSLRDDGLRSIFDGNTTIEEVLKYTLNNPKDSKMPKFTYTAIDQNGKQKTSSINAGSEEEARSKLNSMGLMPTP